MTEEQQVHNKENCWKTKDGEYVPLSEMSNSHLRNAKHYAQAKEEYFWKKMCEFEAMIDAIEEEAARRGITLKDRRSKFQRNQRHLKNRVQENETA